MRIVLLFFSFSCSALLPQHSQTECAAFMGQGVSSQGRYPNGLNARQVHTHNTRTHTMSLSLAGSFVFPVSTSFPISPTVKSLVVFFLPFFSFLPRPQSGTSAQGHGTSCISRCKWAAGGGKVGGLDYRRRRETCRLLGGIKANVNEGCKVKRNGTKNGGVGGEGKRWQLCWQDGGGCLSAATPS